MMSSRTNPCPFQPKTNFLGRPESGLPIPALDRPDRLPRCLTAHAREGLQRILPLTAAVLETLEVRIQFPVVRFDEPLDINILNAFAWHFAVFTRARYALRFEEETPNE